MFYAGKSCLTFLDRVTHLDSASRLSKWLGGASPHAQADVSSCDIVSSLLRSQSTNLPKFEGILFLPARRDLSFEEHTNGRYQVSR